MKRLRHCILHFLSFHFQWAWGLQDQEGSPLSWRGMGSLCVCVSVSCPECFLGPERAFWPTEERMPLTVGGGCPDDRPEDQM